MGHYNTAQTTKFTFVLKPQMGVMVLHLLNEPSYKSMVSRLPNVNFNMDCMHNIRFLNEYANEKTMISIRFDSMIFISFFISHEFLP